jgi:hypothetical protein
MSTTYANMFAESEAFEALLQSLRPTTVFVPLLDAELLQKKQQVVLALGELGYTCSLSPYEGQNAISGATVIYFQPEAT